MARTASANRTIIRDFGTALSFDGVTASGTTDNNGSHNSGTFTIAVWIKPIFNGSTLTIVAKEALNAPDFRLTSGGNTVFSRLGNSSFFTSATKADYGKWNFVAFSYNNTTKDYVSCINGLDSGNGNSDQNFDVNRSFALGREAGFGSLFNGLMDDFRWYNSALTLVNLQDLYYNANDPDPTNLKVWWKMEENAGTTVTDSSGNANTLTMTNGAWTPSMGQRVPSSSRISSGART